MQLYRWAVVIRWAQIVASLQGVLFHGVGLTVVYLNNTGENESENEHVQQEATDERREFWADTANVRCTQRHGFRR